MVSGICLCDLCCLSRPLTIPVCSTRYLSLVEICLIKSPWVTDVVQRYNSQLLFFKVDTLCTIIPHTSGNFKLGFPR